MKKLISFVILLALTVSLCMVPAHAAENTFSTATLSFGKIQVPEKAMVLSGVYLSSGKMVYAAGGFEQDGKWCITIPEQYRTTAEYAKLFVLDENTLMPLCPAVSAKTADASPDLPAPSANALFTVVLGNTYQEVATWDALTAALDASGNSLVIMNKDDTYDGTIALPRSCTLDLGGHTLTATTLELKKTGTENKVFTLQNGTLASTSTSNPAIKWRTGGLVIRDAVVRAESYSAIWCLNHAGYTSTAGDFKDVNCISNSQVLSKLFSISFNSSKSDFSAVSIRFENSDFIVTGTNANLNCQSGDGFQSGTYVLGENVNFYTTGGSYIKTTSPQPTVAGMAVTRVGGSHVVTVGDTKIGGLNKWTTYSKTAETEEEQAVLMARREAAEAYLREMASLRWRSDATVSYTYSDSQTNPIEIVKDRLYEGLPYSYAGASLDAWLDYASGPDAEGVYDMTGLSADVLGGGSGEARIGIDCSATLSHAWQSIGATVRTESTDAMTPNNGFIHVGDYEAPLDQYTDTRNDCQDVNGQDVMFAAYAQLQKADGIVTSHDSGHARFVVGVEIVLDENGNIDGDKSMVQTIEKNASQGRADIGKPYYDSEVGEDVYPCLDVDKKYSFNTLYNGGYLPVTCLELTDPTPIDDPVVADSVGVRTIDNLLEGTIGCSWALDNITITITSGAGQVVQSAAIHPVRRTELNAAMSQFVSDAEGKLLGTLDLEGLSGGSYRCTITARTVAGDELTVSQFDFTK